MNDHSALASKLAALIARDAVFDDNGRVISQAGAPPPLVAVLQEIDDTVLERKLSFTIDNSRIDVIAAGRRLQGIVEIDGDIPGQDDVVGQVLSREEPKILKAAGAIIASLFQPDTRIAVRSVPAARMGDGGQAGVSISALSEFWKVDLDAEPAPPVTRFLAANADAVTGSLYSADGAKPKKSGKAAPLQDIWDNQIVSFRKGYKALRGQDDGPMLICLDAAIKGKTAAALAIARDEICVFSYDPALIGDILGSWYAATR